MATIKRKSPGRIGADLLIFSIGLAAALWMDWKTVDLVWSLWLSSLVVGYITILGTILFFVLGKTKLKPLPNERGTGLESIEEPGSQHGIIRVGLGIFFLGFFSVHFVGFHLGHAVFLNVFFPITAMEEWYSEALVARAISYLPFVVMMALGERERIQKAVGSFELTGPYLNVVRMHLLIFFFAGTHFLGVDHVFTFVVVYVVYFSPWQFQLNEGTDGHG